MRPAIFADLSPRQTLTFNSGRGNPDPPYPGGSDSFKARSISGGEAARPTTYGATLRIATTPATPADRSMNPSILRTLETGSLRTNAPEAFEKENPPQSKLSAQIASTSLGEGDACATASSGTGTSKPESLPSNGIYRSRRSGSLEVLTRPTILLAPTCKRASRVVTTSHGKRTPQHAAMENACSQISISRPSQ